MLGIGIGTLAIIVVLSAFNGLDDLVKSMYGDFEPDLEITPAKGKTFSTDSISLIDVITHPAIDNYARNIEETVMFKVDQKQTFAKIKGVDTSFFSMCKLDSSIWKGQMFVGSDQGTNYVIPGYFIADDLGILYSYHYDRMVMYAPNKKVKRLQASNGFVTQVAMMSGIFSINADYDSKYVLASYDFASEMLQSPNRVTSILLNVKKGYKGSEVKEELKAIIGSEYVVKTKYEQNELLYKTNETEKYATFLILSFILVIASFNILGSLSMLMLDKKEDIYTLRAMGSTKDQIKKIFLIEGWMISILGGTLGLILGVILILVQQQFGIIPAEGIIVDSYPVSLRFSDILLVIITVWLLGLVAAYIPTKILSKRILV